MSEAIQDFGLLRNTQDAVILKLQTDPQLFGPPAIGVIKDDEGDVQSAIQKSIGPIGSGGGCVIVSCPKPIARDLKRPWLFRASMQIQCVETPIVNRSAGGNQVRAMRLGEIVFNLLDGWSSELGWTEMLMIDSQWGETDEGWQGAVLNFQFETVYEKQTQP